MPQLVASACTYTMLLSLQTVCDTFTEIVAEGQITYVSVLGCLHWFVLLGLVSTCLHNSL